LESINYLPKKMVYRYPAELYMHSCHSKVVQVEVPTFTCTEHRTLQTAIVQVELPTCSCRGHSIVQAVVVQVQLTIISMLPLQRNLHFPNPTPSQTASARQCRGVGEVGDGTVVARLL
jgi:hypothetical protein